MTRSGFRARRTMLRFGLAGAVGWASGALAPRRTFAAAHTALSDSLHLFQGSGGDVVFATDAEEVRMMDGITPSPMRHSARPVPASSRTTTRVCGSVRRSIRNGNIASIPPQPARALPTQTFFNGLQKHSFGGQDIEYAIMPQAHTDGDIYVLFPRENVLVAGGVVTGGSYPLADYCTGGWLGGMIGGLRTILARSDARTRIVSGKGATRSRAGVQAQLDMCSAVLSKMATSYTKGQTWEEFQASRPTGEFDARWGDPEPFLRMAWDGAESHVKDMAALLTKLAPKS